MGDDVAVFFLRLAAENAELRQQLGTAQDLQMETATDAGRLHARIEVLQAERDALCVRIMDAAASTSSDAPERYAHHLTPDDLDRPSPEYVAKHLGKYLLAGDIPYLRGPPPYRQQDRVEQEGDDQPEGQSLPQRSDRKHRSEEAVEQTEGNRKALVQQSDAVIDDVAGEDVGHVLSVHAERFENGERRRDATGLPGREWDFRAPLDETRQIATEQSS
jgi:hypothetical protein